MAPARGGVTGRVTTDVAATLRAGVAARRDEMIDVRRALHARPELSWAEHATTALVRERMRQLAIPAARCPTETGGVFVLEGGRPGRTILLRADLDALPVHEEVDLTFRSRVDGAMHACGHDAHAAMLLGVAGALAGVAESLPGRYAFLFQPAEEQISGARAMIEGGVLDGLGADALVGCHVASVFPAGSVAIRPGIAMADGQALRFVIMGAGGHGAIRAARGDVVRAAAELVRALGGVTEDIAHEGAPGACSAGVVHAGRACNVIPREALVEGTLRTYTPAQRELALDRLRALCERFAGDLGVEVALTLGPRAPAVENDPAATAVVGAAAARVLGPAAVLAVPPLPPSDDVSEFLARVPGCYFFVGAARPDGSSGMHHSATFAIDEAALGTGALVLAEAAVALATPPE